MAAIAHDHEPTRYPVLPREGRSRHLVLVPDVDAVRAGQATARRPIPAAVYRRRRLAAVVMLAALLVVTVATAGRVAAFVGEVGGATAVSPTMPAAQPAPAAAGPDARPGVGAVYVVQPGDTVWSVARRLKPTGDVRGLVDRIVARNGGAALRPGQALVVG
jgi:nucleoid-associated protein YgaU